MDAIIMHSITSLVSKLQRDFAQFQFCEGSDFHWSPAEKTIYYRAESLDGASLLHELAHALLGHEDYAHDVTLLAMERAAWSYARRQLGPAYNLPIDVDTVEDALDTYRDWLHARSMCPHCRAVGIQTDKRQYHCIACHEKWRVNDARICALRRYKQ